jgi:hypothetical protein
MKLIAWSSITSGIKLLLYEWMTMERRCRIAEFSGRTIATRCTTHLLLLESGSMPASRAPYPLE